MDKRGTVLAAGLALIVTSAIMNGQFAKLIAVIWQPGSAGVVPGEFAQLGGELILIAALTLVAGASDEAGSVSLWFLAGLWLALLLSHLSVVDGWLKKIGVAK